MKKTHRRPGPHDSKLRVVGSTPAPTWAHEAHPTQAVGAPEAQPPEALRASEWLSEQDFRRTLELVDRTLGELKASEARTEELKVAYENLMRDSEEKMEAAQERVRSAEERAARAEEWARHVEERAARAEARADVAEERTNALEDWANQIQNAIEVLGQ